MGSNSWPLSLQHAIRTIDELLECVEVTRDALPPLDHSPDFPLLVPREFVARMEKGNPSDPLLLQVLPQAAERSTVYGYLKDAVGDSNASKTPGLLHKYRSRTLLIASGLCAVNCRYCFRRHYPYDEAPRSMAHWEATLSYIQNHTEVEEVILSGGDPLSLGNNKLFELLKRIEQVPHVRRLRIHTRFPVMIPSRIDDGFLQAVKELHKPVWMVLHINHPNEIDLALSNALTALRKSGVVLLNQAVLLKGINDSIETQRALCNRLVNEGVQPYYLHQLDRVEGTAHFESDERLGVAIIEQLRSEISGYAVPEFVREIAGQPSKTPIR